MWFFIYKKESPKAIPKHIIDKGCSNYKNTNENIKQTKLMNYIINKFDGEIISKKYKKPFHGNKKHRKKWVKSPHKYSFRKD